MWPDLECGWCAAPLSERWMCSATVLPRSAALFAFCSARCHGLWLDAHQATMQQEPIASAVAVQPDGARSNARWN